MCTFKLQMHQNPFSAGASPPSLLGAYDAPSDPLVGWGGDKMYLSREMCLDPLTDELVYSAPQTPLAGLGRGKEIKGVK